MINISRENTLERYIMGISSDPAASPGPHFQDRGVSSQCFNDNNNEPFEEVSLTDAINILREATNSPQPSQYLIKVWRDFSSLSESSFFSPSVKVEVELDPLALPPELMEQEEEEEEVVVKEEVLDHAEYALPEAANQQERSPPAQSFDHFIKEEDIKAEPCCEDEAPSSSPRTLFIHEDDSSLLEDIDDILQSTQKPSPQKKKKKDPLVNEEPLTTPSVRSSARILMKRKASPHDGREGGRETRKRTKTS
ncbi:Hypothetical protein FKW44_006507 [Caligus rogercresseyi]|uniref:Uncharacterized protein n=1 Tax=Caligus rogercresseyi TaxID=217165 RepID=A0A7T8KDG6_CALRO|nr:Hypothetical protein FKW44_006507 [Caligus rogercresseyi]